MPFRRKEITPENDIQKQRVASAARAPGAKEKPAQFLILRRLKFSRIVSAQ
jgi:hypothetical protein